MPPLVGKKIKGRDGRQSRSRNTTPSSLIEVSIPSIAPSITSFTELPIGNLMVPSNITYDDILERHGGAGAIPDPNHLTTMAKDLKQLCELATARSDACNTGMRILADRRKDALAEEREREREQEQARHVREAEEREALKRDAEDEDEIRGRKGGKLKKKKERSGVREERPPNHGAHGLARQDGLDLPLEGKQKALLFPLRMLQTLSFLQ